MSSSIYHYTYLITNTTNQMKYIGVRSCSVLPENDSDYMGSSKILGEAMGIEPESFVKTIIDTFPTRENANADEQRLHEMYDVARNPEFYNLCIAPKKFNMCGRTHSLETRKKMSKAQSGEKNPFYGKTHTDETKKKQSKSQSGKYLSEEHKKKIGKSMSGSKNHNYGKPKSNETKKKLSISLMGRKFSEKTRKKMSDSQKGIPKAKITCPHCNKTGGTSNMKRWHFNNCKKVTHA